MSTGAEEAWAEGRTAVMAARDEYEAAADRWNAALVKGSPDHRHLAMTMHEAQLRLDEIEGAHPAAWAEIHTEDEAAYLGREPEAGQ